MYRSEILCIPIPKHRPSIETTPFNGLKKFRRLIVYTRHRFSKESKTIVSIRWRFKLTAKYQGIRHRIQKITLFGDQTLLFLVGNIT